MKTLKIVLLGLMFQCCSHVNIQNMEVAEWNPSQDILINRLNKVQWDSFEKLIRLNHSKGTLDWNNLNTMLREVGYVFPDNYVEYRRFSPKVIKKLENARKKEINMGESVLTGFYVIHRDIKYYAFKIIVKNNRYYQLSGAIVAKLNKVVKDQFGRIWFLRPN